MTNFKDNDFFLTFLNDTYHMMTNVSASKCEDNFFFTITVHIFIIPKSVKGKIQTL